MLSWRAPSLLLTEGAVGVSQCGLASAGVGDMPSSPVDGLAVERIAVTRSDGVSSEPVPTLSLGIVHLGHLEVLQVLDCHSCDVGRDA